MNRWHKPTLGILLLVLFSFAILSYSPGGATGMAGTDKLEVLDFNGLEKFILDAGNKPITYDKRTGIVESGNQRKQVDKNIVAKVENSGVVFNDKGVNVYMKTTTQTTGGSSGLNSPTRSGDEAQTAPKYKVPVNGKYVYVRQEDFDSLKSGSGTIVPLGNGDYSVENKEGRVLKHVIGNKISYYDANEDLLKETNDKNQILYETVTKGDATIKTEYEYNSKGDQTEKKITTTQGQKETKVTYTTTYEEHGEQIFLLTNRVTEIVKSDKEITKEQLDKSAKEDEKYNIEQVDALTDRKKKFDKTMNSLQKYGVGNAKITQNNVGGTLSTTVTFKPPSGSGYMTVTGSVDSNSEAKRTITLHLGNEEYRYIKGGPLEGGYYIDKNNRRYDISKKCSSTNTGPCMRHGSLPPIYLSDDLYKMSDNPDDLSAAANDLTDSVNGENMPDSKKNWNDYGAKLENIMSSELRNLFSNHVDELLGEFSNGIPNAMCNIYAGTDYSVEKGEDGTYSNKFFGGEVTKTNYVNSKEQEIYNDIRTAILFGSVEMIDVGLFRYEVSIKLIGDDSTGAWALYLRHSKDGNTSNGTWSESGSIGYGQIFQMLYAGADGEDMIFECGVDPHCKFNQACLKFADESSPRCFYLAAPGEKQFYSVAVYQASKTLYKAETFRAAP